MRRRADFKKCLLASRAARRRDGKLHWNNLAPLGVSQPSLQARQPMTHRVYSGPRGSPAISPLDKDRMPFKEFDTSTPRSLGRGI
jgi:hypothetical protein